MTGTVGPQLVGPSDDEVEVEDEVGNEVGDGAAHAAPRTTVRSVHGPRLVLLAAGLLVLCQLAVRIWMVAQRDLYADDLQYGSEAFREPLLSGDFLFGDRGGHFMPAAMLLTGLLSRAAPLEWWPVATTLVVLQLVASLAVLRLLRVVLGDRPALLVPLAVYLFCPLSLGSFVWWSAAMNSVPLQIGLAWVVADALLLARTGRRRHAVSGTVALLLTLLFYERAVLVPVLAFALVAVLLHVDGVTTPLRAAWRRGRALWCGALLVLIAWAVAFTTVVPGEAVGSATVGQVVDMTRVAAESLLPALVGGPVHWAELPGTPVAAAPGALTAFAAAVAAAVVLWTSWRRRGAGFVWAVAVGYFLVGAVLVGLGRGAMVISTVLPMTYRYFAAEALVFALALALVLALPARGPAPADRQLRVLLDAVVEQLARRTAARQTGRFLVPVLTVAFVAASLATTITYMHAWQDDPTPGYLATARSSLAAAGDSPLLDQNVPDDVMWGPFDPWNRASHVFGPLRDRPEFAEATDDLRMLDDDGLLRPAAVAPGVLLAGGPQPGCGWRVGAGAATAVPLEVPLYNWVWTVQLDYTAGRDGVLTVAMTDGGTVTAPVQAGSHSVYLRLVGGGTGLQVAEQTHGLDVCIRSGVVGNSVLQ